MAPYLNFGYPRTICLTEVGLDYCRRQGHAESDLGQYLLAAASLDWEATHANVVKDILRRVALEEDKDPSYAAYPWILQQMRRVVRSATAVHGEALRMGLVVEVDFG
jgi:hypothetical protein